MWGAIESKRLSSSWLSSRNLLSPKAPTWEYTISGTFVRGSWGIQGPCVDLCSSRLLENLPLTHICLQGFTISLNCHGCEKGLSYLFDPWWTWLLPHLPFGSISVLLFLIFKFASGKPVRSSVGGSEILVKGFKGAHSSLLMGRHWEAVGLQLSCPSSIKTKFPQDFQRPSHSVRSSSVRCVFITNFISSSFFLSFSLSQLKKAPLIGNVGNNNHGLCRNRLTGTEGREDVQIEEDDVFAHGKKLNIKPSKKDFQIL